MKKVTIRPQKFMYTVIYAIIFFALIKPDSLEHLGFKWLANILVGVDIVLILVLSTLMLRGKFKMSKMTGLIFLFFVFRIYCNCVIFE